MYVIFVYIYLLYILYILIYDTNRRIVHGLSCNFLFLLTCVSWSVYSLRELTYVKGLIRTVAGILKAQETWYCYFQNQHKYIDLPYIF